MADNARSPYRFGSLLAFARRSWIEQVRERMQEAGFPGYRRSDAGVLALLLQQPLAIGQLGEAMGISRQAARQMADGLVERGYATFGTDDADARRTLVVLTPRGKAYGRAIWTAQTLSTRRCGVGLAKRTSPRPTPCSELCSPTRTPASEWTSGCPRQARVRYPAAIAIADSPVTGHAWRRSLSVLPGG